MIPRRLVLFAVAMLVSVSAFAAGCDSCGRVSEVRTVKVKGEGSGVGAVAGGVVGGLLGNQIGGGRGKTVATVAGVAGGAYAGHQVEKNVKETTEYQVVVKMDNGKTRKVKFPEQPDFRRGDRVRLDNGVLTRTE